MLWSYLIYNLLFSFYFPNISLKYKPPGTLKLKELHFFVDKTEITNSDWGEYIYYLKKKYGINSKEYKNALPDSSVWFSIYSGNLNSLSLNCKYQNYPVVGISYQQAIQYCKWRSKMVNLKYKKYKTTYFLPSIEDWEKIYKIINVKETRDTIYPYMYKKVNGIVGLCDNVSEMTSKHQVAIGGNWKHNNNCSDTINYCCPQNWLGFRCIAIYKKIH